MVLSSQGEAQLSTGHKIQHEFPESISWSPYLVGHFHVSLQFPVNVKVSKGLVVVIPKRYPNCYQLVGEVIMIYMMKYLTKFVCLYVREVSLPFLQHKFTLFLFLSGCFLHVCRGKWEKKVKHLNEGSPWRRI